MFVISFFFNPLIVTKQLQSHEYVPVEHENVRVHILYVCNEYLFYVRPSHAARKECHCIIDLICRQKYRVLNELG